MSAPQARTAPSDAPPADAGSRRTASAARPECRCNREYAASSRARTARSPRAGRPRRRGSSPSRRRTRKAQRGMGLSSGADSASRDPIRHPKAEDDEKQKNAHEQAKIFLEHRLDRLPEIVEERREDEKPRAARNQR